MSQSVQDRCIVLVCGREGAVQRIIRDDFGLSAGVHSGSSLNDLVDTGGREKVALLLSEIQSRQAAYDWEIAATVDRTLVTLHFAGASLDAGFLIIGALSRDGLALLNDELMRINNEQTNIVRATAKELSLAVEMRPERDEAVYEELTKLNNEMANMQREMAKKNIELEQLNEQKNCLLGMAAHDLRTPLGAILTYSEYLQTEAAAVLNEEQREFVETIREMSEFMLHLVSDLLDVTAIEAGRLNLDRQPADLNRLIQRNVTLNRVLAAKKDIAVEFDPRVALPALTFDAGKIEQVLNNLISNAIKFSHRGTRVQIRVEFTPETVTVAVQDEGQGIPAAGLSKLFKPFSKANVRTTAGEQSTGLGLAIVRRIVEGHGGRIWVDSKVGVGSTFYFTLPVASDA